MVDWVSPLFSEQLKSFHLLLLPWGLFRSAPHGFLSWRSIGISSLEVPLSLVCPFYFNCGHSHFFPKGLFPLRFLAVGFCSLLLGTKSLIQLFSWEHSSFSFLGILNPRVCSLSFPLLNFISLSGPFPGAFFGFRP